MFRHYSGGLIIFDKQQGHLTAIRKRIQETTSWTKRVRLEPKPTPREWLVRRMEDTKPDVVYLEDNIGKRCKKLCDDSASRLTNGPTTGKPAWEAVALEAMPYDTPGSTPVVGYGTWLELLGPCRR